MEVREDQGSDDGQAPSAARPRRPYVPPVIVSGEAFERVQLASGCDTGIEECEIPC